ncbi:hypothetical protein BJ965_003698 [Streptomyces luteogriseus]|uniref:Uncharacterized protein n=1 Tax=Streptomyces luteogriseus TaxID=68233 RepID=A0A7W7DNE3_9ACTN|nr:hypothetical protein [Streptomyces luteogriseus]
MLSEVVAERVAPRVELVGREVVRHQGGYAAELLDQARAAAHQDDPVPAGGLVREDLLRLSGCLADGAAEPLLQVVPEPGETAVALVVITEPYTPCTYRFPLLPSPDATPRKYSRMAGISASVAS